MNQVLWIVQKNLGDTMTQVFRALELHELHTKFVDVIPFSDALPRVEWDGPIICYGSTHFIAKVQANRPEWFPGTFFNPKTFTFSQAQQAFGEDMLNRGARITSLAAFTREHHPGDQLFFVRPDADLKEFAGSVLAFSEVSEWYDRVSAGGYTIDPNVRVAIAEPVNILREWRLFMIQGRCVEASQYRQDGRLVQRPGAPLAVVRFAERLAQTWMPAPVAVFDVAQTPLRLGLVEINCFNSAGFYASNVGKVFLEVTRFVEETFRAR